MTSLTVTFTGTSSLLHADFFPEVVLDPKSNYCCGLLDFTTYNSIANIIENRNNEFKFRHYVEEKKKVAGKDIISLVARERQISLPTGSYEVEDILKHLKSELNAFKINLSYEISTAFSKVRITFNNEIDWIDGSILNVIGFQRSKLSKFKKNVSYWSENIVKITEVDVIRIDCDIVSGSYINGEDCHTIHQFSHCKVGPGYKFIEVPQHIVYLPIKEKRLRSIQISIVDQNGNLVDFRGEQISCRIHIKKVNDIVII